MTRLSIAAAETTDVEVDLWGTVFHTVPVTRTRARAITDLGKKFADADEDDLDARVGLLGQVLDHYLAPEAGKRKKPSAVIDEKWQADQLEYSRLIELVLEEIPAAAGRPT